MFILRALFEKEKFIFDVTVLNWFVILKFVQQVLTIGLFIFKWVQDFCKFTIEF